MGPVVVHKILGGGSTSVGHPVMDLMKGHWCYKAEYWKVVHFRLILVLMLYNFKLDVSLPNLPAGLALLSP